MRSSSLLVTLAIAVSTVFAAEGESDVIELNSKNFGITVDRTPIILVEFFAPWCGHCKALAPHYEEAATALKEHDIKLAKVDCVDQADLCQVHGVKGYPTLKVFHDGVSTEYGGPRKADGIISYMLKQALPAISTVSAADLETFQKADKMVALAYLESAAEPPAKAFNATANKYRDDCLFGITTDGDAIAAAGVTPPTIIVYRSFDEGVVEFPYPIRSATELDIGNWIKELSIPLIDEVHGENYAVYVESAKPLAYLFLDPSDEKKEEYIDVMRPVAAKYRGSVNFVWIDAIKYGDHAKALNLVEPKWPSFVLQDLATQLKYPYDQNTPVDPERVSEMVEKFVTGQLVPELKSQPIPEKQDENVFNLVGKQFEEIVFDDSKDVFVEFYASWCGHCKRLKPIWDTLGDHYANVKDRLVIAKMEAQENDLPASVPFRISGFPTLKFKPAGSREFLDYNGDRTLESFIEYIEEQAVNKLDADSNITVTEEEQVVFEIPEVPTEVPEVQDVHDEL